MIHTCILYTYKYIYDWGFPRNSILLLVLVLRMTVYVCVCESEWVSVCMCFRIRCQYVWLCICVSLCLTACMLNINFAPMWWVYGVCVPSGAAAAADSCQPLELSNERHGIFFYPICVRALIQSHYIIFQYLTDGACVYVAQSAILFFNPESEEQNVLYFFCSIHFSNIE